MPGVIEYGRGSVPGVIEYGRESVDQEHLKKTKKSDTGAPPVVYRSTYPGDSRLTIGE